MTPTWRLIVGDVSEQLALLPEASVQCVVTSPPYWGLRDYGTEGQIGLETTPAEYVAKLVQVFEQVRRVLRDDGVLWLNLGDCYANDGKWGGETGGKQSYLSDNDRKRVGREKRVTGLKPKDLVGIPWTVALSLRDAGWWLRRDIIWSKPNGMCESVQDRPTGSHEYIFLLTKAAHYYYDAKAIEEVGAVPAGTRAAKGSNVRSALKDVNGRPPEYWEYTGFRNARSVWTIQTQPYPDAHFATFPEALPDRCIRAGSRVGDGVLDPFAGSGTTGQVAIQLGRSFVGIELNPSYAELARTRIGGAAPLFAQEYTA